MTQTTNYGLKKPESNDYYSDFIPEIFGNNMDTLDIILGGAKVSFLTAEDYDNLSAHPEKTVYFVTDSNTVTVYLGDVKLSGGSVPQGVTTPSPLSTSLPIVTGVPTTSDDVPVNVVS